MTTKLLGVGLVVVFFAWIGIAQAETSIALFDNNGQIVLTRQNVQSITESAGTTIHGTASGAAVRSDLENFVQNTSNGLTTFAGEVGAGQSTLQFGNDTTILVVPEKQEFPLSPMEIAMIAVIIAVIVGAVIFRSRER